VLNLIPLHNPPRLGVNTAHLDIIRKTKPYSVNLWLKMTLRPAFFHQPIPPDCHGTITIGRAKFKTSNCFPRLCYNCICHLVYDNDIIIVLSIGIQEGILLVSFLPRSGCPRPPFAMDCVS